MRRTFFALMVCFFTLSSVLPAAAAEVMPPSSGKPDSAAVANAIAEFKSLSRQDRKMRLKAAKKELKAFKAARKAGKDTDTNTVLLVILAILLPPLAVYLYEGEVNTRFWISLILTLLGWLPGIIYALVLILGKK